MNNKNRRLFSRVQRFIITALLPLALIVFTFSCSQQHPSETSYNHASLIKAGDFAPGQLEAHYLKHHFPFGNITQQQYLENARTLLDAAPGRDMLEKTRPNGDILHYRPSTGEFAVMDRNGKIRTYFKTTYQYWLRQ